MSVSVDGDGSMDITAVIITKNEKDNLRSCLEALSDFGVPVLVCDTGSGDGSVELAKEMGASVCHFDWCDDFAAAKNYAASMAESDIILSLDTDEFISEFNEAALGPLIRRQPPFVGRIHIRNRFSYQGDARYSDEYLPRIYDRRYFRFEGRVHEQIRRVGPAASGEISYYDAPVTVIHTGYDLDDEAKVKKADRNLGLLLKELSEFKSDIGPADYGSLDRDTQERGAYIYYQIGKSHYMAGRFPEAAEAFGEGLGFDVDEGRDFLVDMVTSYGYSLINSGRAAEALVLEGVEDVFGEDADFEFVFGLVLMNNARFDEAIDRFERAASKSSSRVEGASSYLAYYNAGVVNEVLGRRDKAVEYYRKCGSYPRAIERLRELG